MRKLFAIIFFIILVFPLLFAAMTAVSVVTWALDRDFYIETLDQPEVYAALSTAPLIDRALNAQLRLPADANATELKTLLQSLLTEEYLQQQVRAYVNGLFDYLQGKTEDFSPVIDLTPLKTALAGEQQDAFLAALLKALPECAPGQSPGFGSDAQAACKPAGIPDDLIIEQALKPALPFVLAQIPDQVPVEGEFAEISENMRWRRYIPGMAAPASTMLGVLILSMIALGVWYLIGLIADAGWHGRLQWLGWTLLIPSLLVFLLGFAFQGGAAAYWINFGLQRIPAGGSELGSTLSEPLRIVAGAALPRISNAFKMVGGISGAFALVFLFWGIATPRKLT